MLFGRNLSASEAQLGGLVDRTLWPGGAEQLRAAAKDLAAQPPQVQRYFVETNTYYCTILPSNHMAQNDVQYDNLMFIIFLVTIIVANTLTVSSPSYARVQNF